MGINVSGALAGLTIKKHMCSKTNAKDKWGNSCKIKKIVFKVKKKQPLRLRQKQSKDNYQEKAGTTNKYELMTNIASKHANYDEITTLSPTRPFKRSVCLVLRGTGMEASSLQIYCLCSKRLSPSLSPNTRKPKSC